MSLITEARTQLDLAEAALITAAKVGIRNALIETFENPEINNVVFGICTAPYNDENPGQGIFGPLVNFLEIDDYGEVRDFTYDDEYKVFYDYHGVRTGTQADALAAVLAEAEWEYAAQALGVGYYPGEGHGSQEVIIAERTKANDDGFSLFHHNVEY